MITYCNKNCMHVDIDFWAKVHVIEKNFVENLTYRKLINRNLISRTNYLIEN